MPSQKQTLSSHPLSKKVTERVYAQLQSHMAKDAAQKGNPRRKQQKTLDPPEQYAYNVFVYLMALVAGVTRLGHSQVFLSTFPQPRTYAKSGILRDSVTP